MFQQFAKDYSLISTFVLIFNFPFSENACIGCLRLEFFPHVFFSVYIALIIMQSFSHVVFIWPTMCDVYCMHRFLLSHMYLLLSLILHLLWCTVCTVHVLSCLPPYSLLGLAASWTIFLHWYLSFIFVTSSVTDNLVHHVMLSNHVCAWVQVNWVRGQEQACSSGTFASPWSRHSVRVFSTRVFLYVHSSITCTEFFHVWFFSGR